MKRLIRFLVVCLLLTAKYVAAVEVKGLFEAEVTVRSQTREDRNIALRGALLIVISRLTTGKEFAQNPVVKSALGNAASYVDQYQYVLNPGDTDKQSTHILRVTFNKVTLMELMRSSGLAVWSDTRDKVLVWLLIEQGGKQFFLDVDQNAEIGETFHDAAKAKGIPLLLPLMDLEEKQAITFKDILASSPDKILAVSARYDVATILSGKLVKRRTCWHSEWALHFNSKTERWADPCSDLRTNLTNALQRVYEHLSVFYALKPSHEVN